MLPGLVWTTCIFAFFFQEALGVALRSDYAEFETENARDILRMAKTAEMKNYMRTDLNPCENFYNYACGNWAQINPAYLDAKTGIFNVLAKAYNRKVSRLLSGAKLTSESDLDRKVKYFFESCLDRDEVRRNYKEQLLSVIEEFGGMPALKGENWQEEQFDWLDVVAKILRKYGKEIIIGVDISADLTNNEVNRLYIGQIEELVTSRAREYYARLKLARQLELQQILGMSSELASKTACEIVAFEKSLAEGISDPLEGLGLEDKTKLRLLEEMTESYKPALNLTRFVQTWLGYEYRSPVYEYVESYLRNLRRLIEETPKKVVANYIMWDLLQDFRMEAEQTHEKQLKACVEVTKRYFVKVTDNMVYRELLRHYPRISTDVQEVWTQLKRAFEQTLNSSTLHWMSENTRDKALEKLSAMTFEISSYEIDDLNNEYGDLTISTENYFENVIRVLELRGRNYRQKVQEPPKLDDGDTLNFTPAYAAEFNKVLIPVAFLQPRYLWDGVYPAALKFSTVGYIMAHELAHGFDDTIRKYDAKGNLNNWWDRNSTERFAMRKECLRQQYGEYRYSGKQLPKTNAQGENIADNVGVRIAYAAYQTWIMQQQNNNETILQQESLPQMDFTPRQLFFIGLAQVWCTDVHRQWRSILTTTDVHAPEEVRVRAMLANFEAFGLEFKCQVGDKMHPRRKCVVY